MKRLAALPLALLLLLGSAAATTDAATGARDGAYGIPFFTAHYVLKKLGMTVARVTVAFGRENGQLVYRQVTLPAGVIAWFRHDRITEESLLAPGPSPLPFEYRFEHSGDGAPKTAVIRFDRKAGMASGHMQNGDAVRVAIEPGTLDRLSLQLALMQAVAQDRKPLRFTTVETKDKLSHYVFEDLGSASVVTPMGRLETRHLQRLWHAKRIRFDFWLAPSLHELPVKLTQTEEGDDTSLALYLQSVDWH
ncbi:DUF3108 domain-containing protein [Acidihalobacter prosperus]|uniref:DUF3108 domain-containing protein n=1 Tax=Acidihalobacter prosperus TaxID=160660 RepID=A0A1A6C5U6_9GAMM|nr:DUF3108 domain-containing protein [Acidihalobacter prosperus]OBS09946.1 hypothetical protein Thpro_020996 [Acidihalobacter prosperus]